MPTPPLRAFYGHHKCATTWIISIARAVCNRLGLNLNTVGSAALFDHNLPQYVAANKIDFLCYSNAVIGEVRTVSNVRAFHVIRDPRDIIVSAYFSHLLSHSTDNWPQLIPHRERLQSVSKDEGLFIEMEFSRQELEDLYEWDYQQPGVLEMKMEAVIAQPYERILEAFQFVGLADDNVMMNGSRSLLAVANAVHARTRGLWPFKFRPRNLAALELLGIVYNNRFETKAGGRRPGEEDAASHYRKGQAGDWVNHFTEDHRQYFKKHYNDLLLKLGYETAPDW